MSQDLSSIIEKLASSYAGSTTLFAGETTLIIPIENLLAAVTAIHDEYDFDLLSSYTAVDYWPEIVDNIRFHLVFRFTSIINTQSLNMRTGVSEISPTSPSLEKIYRNANWHEREIFDMFGIKFEGHSDLRRILMPHDWEGHPLRKDYPLGYEEPQFSFNYDEISARKPYGKNRSGE